MITMMRRVPVFLGVIAIASSYHVGSGASDQPPSPEYMLVNLRSLTSRTPGGTASTTPAGSPVTQALPETLRGTRSPGSTGDWSISARSAVPTAVSRGR